ncbi:unnamed protein product [Periconia digitata]|uniref:Uncharacterized protein n=1 Tax=Periconia digitata TaxID=1303443 RepID=A0A9W4XR00_9PLEO|nr:unnamed protein product [Periconia digitata]
MGKLTTSQEPAPAYEEVMGNLSMNQFTPASSSSGYASVPQEEDIENDIPAHDHNHSSASSAPLSQQPETFAQTIAGVFKKQPHVHCEACDILTERRERRANQRHCCAMVAAVFMTLIFCIMILGIVIANKAGKAKRSGHI